MLRHFLKAAVNDRVGITENTYTNMTSSNRKQPTSTAYKKKKMQEAVASCFSLPMQDAGGRLGTVMWLDDCELLTYKH